jgi:plasmid stability protein
MLPGVSPKPAPLMSTLVIKNLPEPLHERLKAQAERNRRSVTKEAIRLLESGLVAGAGQLELPELVSLRSGKLQTIDDIEAAISEGRD